MKNFFMKPYRYAAVFSILLIASFTFVLMDTFVIPQPLAAVGSAMTSYAAENAVTEDSAAGDSAAGDASAAATAAVGTSATSAATITDNSYEDENIKINIDTVEKYDSTIYIADIQLKDASYLKTALANDVFGRKYQSNHLGYRFRSQRDLCDKRRLLRIPELGLCAAKRHPLP